MNKAVLINLGSGNLDDGFPRVTVQLWVGSNSRPQQFIGSLPAAPILTVLYKNWQAVYKEICTQLGNAQEFGRQVTTELVDEDIDDELEIETEGINNISKFTFDEICENLRHNLNSWLNTPDFLSIERQVLCQLDRESEIQVTLETNDNLIRRLPWHCWQFFEDYPKAELALSQPEYIRQIQKQQETEKVRILAILASTQGIDLAAEQIFLENLENAQTKFLIQPSIKELNLELLNDQGWEILFFAGHSQSEGETGRIYLNEHSKNNSLTIEQLQASLRIAISNGLKLAIFNSCDGLGLANTLEKLHIPTIIVMREPVPNKVAQEFFKHFLTAFALSHKSLNLSVRQAREQLGILERDFPGASWLPVICQNPAVEPPDWLNIAKPVRLVLSSEKIYALQSILLNFVGPIAPTFLQRTLVQARNFDSLIEGLLTRLTVIQQAEFLEQVNLLFAQPEADPEEDENDKLTEDFIHECEQILIQIIGPVGPMLVQEALSLDNQSRKTFVENLAEKITFPELRAEFERRISIED
ncbi:MAG: CHAT domain-containing protein [Cyanobacteriota bacterium]|nr:CHAT domain-containing protein [Cyanobacteriota bacterium]